MTSNEENIFQSLIAGGIIGAALGFLLFKRKDKGATLGALAGAAVLATYEANKTAQTSNVPVFVEENGKLYAIESSGKKRFIKDIPKPSEKLNKTFKLI